MTLVHTNSTITALQELTSDHYADLVAMIGTVVDFGRPGVKNDVENWLRWTLTSGTRPQQTKRAMHANGVNAYAITQDAVCAVLGRQVKTLDWDNPIHFWLIERATRPLNQTARHPYDVRFWLPSTRSA